MISTAWMVLAMAWTIAAEPPVAQKILFIGNSYTTSNDLPTLVEVFYQAVKLPKPEVEMFAMGGASLGDHWSEGIAQQRMTLVKWNYIIMQQGPSSLASSQKEMMTDMETVKPALKKSGATPAMLMVWPDTTRRQYFPQVRQAYARAAKAVDGMFIPAGVAWQDLLKKDPELVLYSQDGLHPTPEGTYVAALVIVAKLTGKDPATFPAKVTWGAYKVNLTAKQHQNIVEAATAALKDTGK